LVRAVARRKGQLKTEEEEDMGVEGRSTKTERRKKELRREELMSGVDEALGGERIAG
jgi:hypothetical protein